MASKKTINNSTRDSEVTNARTWMDFVDKESFNLYPSRGQFLPRLIHTFLTWVEKDTSVEILQFCLEYKIPRSSLYEWREKYPEFKEAMDNVKLFLGSRRRIGALHRKFDKDVVFKDMHCYDPEWIEINKYHADLKKLEGGDKQGNIIIQIPDLVGEKDT